MIDRRYAHLASMIYAAAMAGTLIAGASTAFIIIAVVGGPVIGLLHWGSAPRRRRD